MRRRSVDPGDALVDPIALAALTLLLVNDHILKSAWPGFVTGKLSDIAGLAFFPILLLSGWELLEMAMRKWQRPSMRALVIAICLVVSGFIAIKMLPAGASLVGDALGFAQWLVALPLHALAGHVPSAIPTTTIVVDPTDLVAIPAVAVAGWIGTSRMRRSREPADRQSIASAPG